MPPSDGCQKNYRRVGEQEADEEKRDVKMGNGEGHIKEHGENTEGNTAYSGGETLHG